MISNISAEQIIGLAPEANNLPNTVSHMMLPVERKCIAALVKYKKKRELFLSLEPGKGIQLGL